MTKSELTNVSKVPAITLGFWLIKILATTLGETAGDTLSMTWLGETTPNAPQSWLSGYLVGTRVYVVGSPLDGCASANCLYGDNCAMSAFHLWTPRATQAVIWSIWRLVGYCYLSGL